MHTQFKARATTIIIIILALIIVVGGGYIFLQNRSQKVTVETTTTTIPTTTTTFSTTSSTETKILSDCEKLNDQQNREWCYVNVARTNKDLSICDRIEDSRTRSRYGCYIDVAETKQDLSICEMIKKPDIKDMCYITIAEIKQDPSICDKIIGATVDHKVESQVIKNNCYKNSRPSTEHSFTIPNNWKAFKDENLGFEIQYPKGTKIETDMFSSSAVDLILPYTDCCVQDKRLTIEVDNKKPCTYYMDSGLSLSPVVINGIFFKRIDRENDYRSMHTAANVIEYCTMRNNKAFRLTTIFTWAHNRDEGCCKEQLFDPKKESEIFAQVLSTFKFLK